MKNTKEMTEKKQTTLVLGGTGKTGRRVAERLQNLGWPVRIGSRSGNPPFDWENQATWKPMLQGITSVYITFQPDLAVPGAVNTIDSFVKLAVECGIGKLVLLSGRGEKEAQQCERVVMDSGLDWTILRASWFNQNFSESYLLEPILAGFVALPVGNVGEPFVDTEDIAEAAVAALTEPGHSKQLYELTGPRLLTFREVIGEIASKTGNPIQFEPISTEQYTAALTEHGVPEEYIALLRYLFTEVLDGRNAYLTDGVERALGRKPADFSDYVQRTAATGIWSSSPGK